MGARTNKAFATAELCSGARDGRLNFDRGVSLTGNRPARHHNTGPHHDVVGEFLAAAEPESLHQIVDSFRHVPVPLESHGILQT